jgi:hypothetical protein
MNNILNLITDFKAMKMCLDVEYNLDSFEKLCIMIGMVKNNNKKYMMGFKKVFYNSIK